MAVDAPDWTVGHPLGTPRGLQRPRPVFSAHTLVGCIIDRFEERVLASPEAVAVDDGVRTLTYRQLRDHAADLSRVLAALPDVGAPVAALMTGTVHYAVALMASIAAGRALVPVDMTHPFERRRAILDEARPGLLLVGPDEVLEPGLAPEGIARLAITLNSCAAGPWASADGDPIIGIAFTSGSMGRPKGLAYRQSDILAMVGEYVQALAVGPDDVILSLASMGAGGNQDILSAVLTGARVRLLDLKSAGIAETLRTMAEAGVTVLSMIPLVFRTLMTQAETGPAFARMRAISTGGDRLYGKDISLFRAVLPADAAIRVTQGSTETGVVFQWIVPREFAAAADDVVPSGHVSPAHQVLLTSSDNSPSALDDPQGELMVSGRHMAAGAWQNGRLTTGPFVQPEATGSRRVFDSGDIMRRRADGLFEFVGRRDRQIKMRGLRGDPGEVETALRKLDGVGDVAVVPRYNGPEAVFVAYVVPALIYQPPSASVLRAALADEVPPHMIPAEIRFLPALPRLPNYKTDFAALVALDQASQGPGHSVANDTVEPPGAAIDPAIAQAVASAWADVLGPDLPERPFDESGGDSLKLLQLALHLEAGLGRRLPLDLFELGLSQTALMRRLGATPADRPADHSALPTVILFPGLGGDEPRLAAFRRAFEGRIRFIVIEYPGLEASPAELGSLDRLVEASLAQASAAWPQGPVAVAGYSAGGILALEVARRLQGQGRAPVFVGLIDLSAVRGTDRETGHVGASLHDVLRQLDPRTRTGGLVATLINWAFFVLLDLRAFGLLRRLVLTKSRWRGAHSVTYVRKVLIEYMRGPAILSWRPVHYRGVLTLFRAETQRDPTAPVDLGWGQWCDAVAVHPVPGDHLTILVSPQIETLARRFEAALQTSDAWGHARSPAPADSACR